MKINEVETAVHNNQLLVIKKGELLANNTYVKAAKKTFELLTKTMILGVALTVINAVM